MKLRLIADHSRNQHTPDDEAIWYGYLIDHQGGRVAVACTTCPAPDGGWLSSAGAGAVVAGSDRYHAGLETLIYRTPVGRYIDTDDLLDPEDRTDIIAMMRASRHK